MSSMKTGLIATLILSGLPASLAQQTDVSTLIAHLRNAATSNVAVKEINAAGPEIKKSVADNLPSLMAHEKNDIVLNNESRIAGDLKVIACIPILVTIFLKGDLVPTGLTATMRWRMVDDPAGRALVQIGDPVIPEMTKLLTSDQRDDREKAVRVLGNIKSPAALNVLKEHLPSESDPHLRDVIDRVTAARN
jgi:HEAT repeat protein